MFFVYEFYANLSVLMRYCLIIFWGGLQLVLEYVSPPSVLFTSVSLLLILNVIRVPVARVDFDDRSRRVRVH